MTLQEFRDMVKSGLESGDITLETYAPIYHVRLCDDDGNSVHKFSMNWNVYQAMAICSDLDGGLVFYEDGLVVEFQIYKNQIIKQHIQKYFESCEGCPDNDGSGNCKMKNFNPEED